ncbi:MAG: phage major capsid protein, partial [Lentisphaerae bacterium]|nr:phage major capsid protein [Lentisphaerota bacterium]
SGEFDRINLLKVFMEDEREIEKARIFSKELGEQPPNRSGIQLPLSVLDRAFDTTAGASVVETRYGSVIPTLQAHSVVIKAGAQVINFAGGAQGNLVFPRFETGSNAVAVAEDGNGGDDTITMTAASSHPHTVTATMKVSRRIMALADQNPAQQIIENELRRAISAEIDRLSITGTGTNDEPKGLLYNTDCNTLITSGGLTYDEICDAIGSVEDDNADISGGDLGLITSSKVAKALRKTPIFTGTGTPIWKNIPGVNCYHSNNVPDTFSTNKSGMIVGDFSALAIVFHSGIAITRNPYTYAKTGAVEITAYVEIDILPRYPKSFTICKDI